MSRVILKFDYSYSNIADSDVVNNQVQPLKNVLKDIQQQLEEQTADVEIKINRHLRKVKKPPSFEIKIDLSENYLSDSGVKELLDFVTQNGLLQSSLIKLKLLQNRITENSFDALDKILEVCLRATIDVSINDISTRNFRTRFKDKLERIIFKCY